MDIHSLSQSAIVPVFSHLLLTPVPVSPTSKPFAIELVWTKLAKSLANHVGQQHVNVPL